MTDADAITPYAPEVRLGRIARRLSADITFQADPPAQEVDDDFDEWVALARRLPTPTGFVYPQGGDRWRIVASAVKQSMKRALVAHELAHALLYERNGRIDTEAWTRSSSSPFEEMLCNYLARRMLAPDELLVDRLDPRANFAEQTIFQIGGRFNLPLPIAVHRWLDLVTAMGGRCHGAVYWRQYHPLSHNYIRCCLRDYPDLCAAFLGVAKCLASTRPQLSFQEALLLWQSLFDKDEKQMNLFHPCYVDSIEMHMTPVKVVCQQERDPQRIAAIRKLGKYELARAFTPVSSAWWAYGDAPFVPYKRGAIKPESISGQVAGASGKSASIAVEDVRIGKLSGQYRVHAYADGDGETGKRFVLAMFEPV